MDDHGVADRDVGHGRADLVDPPGVLVPGGVGELDLRLLRPLPLLDVEVRPAQPGSADAHDDVERSHSTRLLDLLQGQWVVVGV